MTLLTRIKPRRIALIAICSAVATAIFLPSFRISTSDRLAAAEEPSLKDTLEKGLKARLPNEFAFIGRVVNLVDQGRLPRRMVLGTFDYARRKGNPKYPFPHFQRAMILRAAKIGVRIN